MDSEVKKDPKELCQSIMNMIPFGIILISRKEHIDYHNNKFAAIFGFDNLKFTTISQWLDIVFSDVDYRKQVGGILFFDIPYTQTGKQRIYTATVFTHQNEEKLIQFTSLSLADNQFLMICEDVTETRILEAKLQQAQKMEAIGSMAGGVAHDINNILMGIQGYVSLMLLDTPPVDKNHDKLKAIEVQINSGSDLTEQLLECARGGRFEPKTIDLNEFIADAAALFGRMRKEIHLSERYSTYVWAVEADTTQLDQAFQNIFSNAAKLLTGRGSLLLKTDNMMLDDSKVARHGIKTGPYVRVSLTVPDTNLDESTKTQLFSPSSVLKEADSKTTVGLACAYGIIKSHSGMIEVTSDSSTGTTFHVFLPASSKTPHKKKPEFSITRTRTGNETILLVDDEKVITDVTGAMLTTLGYDVIIASDGEEAVSIYQEKGTHIDLVIMDVVMPGMGGGEAIDLIREINPQVKVILCSGYSMSGAVKAIMDKGVQTFLKKPFRMNDFSQKIREVLES
jgi:signal transduction histidine kinase/CheY-like chemotaxis protein